MRKITLFIFFVLFLFGCEKKSKPETSSVVSDLKTNATLVLSCYTKIDEQSSVKMKITEVSDSVSGYLCYAISGKDKNIGTFKGKIHEDTFFAHFDFISEGIKSRREVAFKIQDDYLIEGHGEVTVSDNTVTFSDRTALTFSETIKLLKTECVNTDCLSDFGFKKSTIKSECIDVTLLTPKLNPLENGAMVKGEPSFVLFSSDLTIAEVFLPDETEGILLKKNKQGNWINNEYKLIAWKGFVLQKNDIPIFGGQ